MKNIFISLEQLENFQCNFYIKSYKTPLIHPLSRICKFGKATEGVKMTPLAF